MKGIRQKLNHNLKVSLTKAAKVWDDFVKDNYLYTYGSKQRPLIPTWKDIYEDYFAIKYYPNPPAIKKSNRNLKIATVFRSGGTYTQDMLITYIIRVKNTLRQILSFIA